MIDEDIMMEQEDIKEVITKSNKTVQAYADIFLGSRSDILSLEQAQELSKLFEAREILLVLKGMHSTKAP